MNEVSVSHQLVRRDRHFLPAGNNPERANPANRQPRLGQMADPSRRHEFRHWS